MNTIGYFEIQSSDVNREAAFYKAVFGWHFSKEETFRLIITASKQTASMAGRLRCLNSPFPAGAGRVILLMLTTTPSASLKWMKRRNKHQP